MKMIKLSTILVLSLVCFSVSAEAQKTKRTTPKVITTTTTAATQVSDLKAGTQKVSIQIQNVARFLYLLGGVARSIEDIEKEAKTKKIAKAAFDQNEANKQSVIKAIRNLRAGLAALEVEFRTKPALKKYLLQIEGITALSAQTEDSAVAGRFTDSGRPLLLVVEKLSDTLAAMP